MLVRQKKGVIVMEQALEQTRSLWDLLDLLEKIDEGILNLSIPEQESILKESQVKIDRYKAVIDRLENHSRFLGERAAEFTDQKRIVDSKVKRIKEYLIRVLRLKGTDRWTGETFQVKIANSEAVHAIAEPNSALSLQFPKLVNRRYSWDKRALKEELSKEKSPLHKFARIIKNENVKFSFRKPVKDRRSK